MASNPALGVVQLATDELPRGPWIYARQVEDATDVENGSAVEVLDASGRFVGHALYNGASDIRLRWLSRGRKNALERLSEFLFQRLRAADELRRRNLRLHEVSNTYRVCHAEGDDLPGLIVDRLAGVLVCEYHALGFLRLSGAVEESLLRLYPSARVLHRVPPGAARAEGIDPREIPAVPQDEELTWIEEHGLSFPVRPAFGHKTGWFCDQRENRLRIGALARDRTVLDLFCNAGGFALHAARAGARSVRAVDLDEKALELAERAVQANRLSVTCLHADAFDVLRATAEEREAARPDLVICDPHKFVPSRALLESGRKKYLDLYSLALRATRPGGLLVGFSCSGALELEGFLGLLFAAARRAERGVRLLAILEAGPDHPQRPDWPRSRYLKGALLALDR